MKTCKNIEVDSNEFVYPWLTNFENDVATIKQPRGMNLTNIIASLACSGILGLFRCAADSFFVMALEVRLVGVNRRGLKDLNLFQAVQRHPLRAD